MVLEGKLLYETHTKNRIKFITFPKIPITNKLIFNCIIGEAYNQLFDSRRYAVVAPTREEACRCFLDCTGTSLHGYIPSHSGHAVIIPGTLIHIHFLSADKLYAAFAKRNFEKKGEPNSRFHLIAFFGMRCPEWLRVTKKSDLIVIEEDV